MLLGDSCVRHGESDMKVKEVIGIGMGYVSIKYKDKQREEEQPSTSFP